MVIDTSSYDSIKKTIVENFNLTESQLFDFILQVMNDVRKKFGI